MKKPTTTKPAARPTFVLCVRPGDSEDLEIRKVYQVLADQKAAKEGYIRIVDESGEDYLYPAECFAPVKLQPATVREFATALSPGREPVQTR